MQSYRDDYLDYAQLTEKLHALAAAHPDLVRLTSIAKTPEGRELWLLTLGEHPDRERPSIWVDGNMHATEVAGTNVALAIAEAKLALHGVQGGAAGGATSLPKHLQDTLRELRFFILPRMSPDGAEVVLKHGRYVRSNPRDDRALAPKPRWLNQDADGDGEAMWMRVVDATGEYIESSSHPGFMIPRELEDVGPFYKIYPEGVIEHFDGNIPSPHYLADNDTDLNRNFPFTWKPEPDQAGAGAYPLSSPEARAVVEFTTLHPTIFAWLNLHTFGGVFIRPLGDAPDEKMNTEDLAVWKQIGEFCATHAGYPMVSGFTEFTYEPDKPLYGDLCDYAYHQRGALAYVCELWDIFNELGLPAKKRFVDRYSELSRADWHRLADWDRSKNGGRIQRPWRAFQHPQLGPVEIGGVDIRVGISNPPLDRIAEICDKQVAAFLRVAALAPTLHITHSCYVETEGLTRIEVNVENRGYLSTYFVAASQKLTHVACPYAELACGLGVTAATRSGTRQALGHLRGYGRGAHAVSLFGPGSEGSTSRATATFWVRGCGSVQIRVGCARMGTTIVDVSVGKTPD
jgi:Zinc carboxypeptidase